MNSTERYLVEEELEHYRDGWIGRRDFLRRAALLGVGAAAAAAMANSVTPRPARSAPAAQNSPFHVPETDPAVASDWASYVSTDGVMVRAYLAWPAEPALNAQLPGVAICHENRGLQPQIRDVARRFAKQGYVAIAPDLPSRTGTPTAEMTSDEQIMEAFRSLTPEQNALDFTAALDFIRAEHPVDGGKLAATGYCFGGGVTWRLATVYPQLAAAAPFYGSGPPLESVPNIRAAMLGVYASSDDRINAGIPDLSAALDAAGVTYRVTVYPDSDHGFHNDAGRVYNQSAAVQAWMDTLNWFAEHLSLPAPTF
jgi:carboxymethylenebutenolidase